MTSAAALVSVERREEVRLPRFAGNQGPQDDPEDSLQGDCVVPPADGDLRDRWSASRSPVLPGPYEIADLGRDVLALMDALGLDRSSGS
jgi:hypothetical protein